MKLPTLAHTLLALLCSATFAQADWVLVQKTTVEGEQKEMTTKIKGEQARVDVGGEMTMILDASGMTMLMHAQKVMMKADPATMKAMMEASAKAADPTKDQPKAKPAATGEKEKLGEWNTEIFTWEGSMGKGRFWVTKDIAKSAEINAVSDRLGKAMGNPMASVVPLASDFDGMVVKSEMTMMGKTITTTLSSVAEQDIDVKEFALPEGYTTMTMPVPQKP